MDQKWLSKKQTNNIYDRDVILSRVFQKDLKIFVINKVI